MLFLALALPVMAQDTTPCQEALENFSLGLPFAGPDEITQDRPVDQYASGSNPDPQQFEQNNRKYQAELKKELRQTEARMAKLRKAVASQYPGARVKFLDQGGESIVFSVLKKDGTSLAVKVPLKPKKTTSVLKSYALEKTILALAKERDPQGTDYLIPQHEAPKLATPGRQIQPLVMVLGETTLKSMIPKLGPKTPPADLLELWRMMALGVRAVGRTNYVHGDIKPGNWIVKRGENGQSHLYLSDFGMAQIQGGGPSGWSPRGTLAYMSEDQLNGAPPDRKHDLNALQISMKETLMGKSLWELEPREPRDHVRLVDLNELGTVPILSGLPEDTKEQAPAVLRSILLREYSTVEELLHEIERAQRDN